MSKDNGIVKIRVWPPSPDNKRDKYGHASLQTHDTSDKPGIYASFWPFKSKYSITSPDIIKSNNRGCLKTLNADEKHYTDLKISPKEYELHRLDVEKIHEAYEKFKDSDFDFDINASIFSKFKEAFRKPPDAEYSNCVKLVLLLLKAGGIDTEFTLWGSFVRTGVWGALIGGLVGGIVGFYCAEKEIKPTNKKFDLLEEFEEFDLSQEPQEFDFLQEFGEFNVLQETPELQVLQEFQEDEVYIPSNRVIPMYTRPGVNITWVTFVAAAIGVGFKSKSARLGALFGALGCCVIGTALDYLQLPDLVATQPSDLNELLSQVKDIREGKSLLINQCIRFFKEYSATSTNRKLESSQEITYVL